MQIAGFDLSQHAKDTFQDRSNILPEWIERAILEPDWTESYSPKEFHYIRRIPEFGDRFLRVIVNPKKKVIVTFFFDRRLKK